MGTLHITEKNNWTPKERDSYEKADVSSDQIGARPVIIVVSHVKDRYVLFLRVKTKIR